MAFNLYCTISRVDPLSREQYTTLTNSCWKTLYHLFCSPALHEDSPWEAKLNVSDVTAKMDLSLQRFSSPALTALPAPEDLLTLIVLDENERFLKFFIFKSHELSSWWKKWPIVSFPMHGPGFFLWSGLARPVFRSQGIFADSAWSGPYQHYRVLTIRSSLSVCC